MKYIKTADGKVFDLAKIIADEKTNPYYTDYKFEEIKNEDGVTVIRYSAIGTKENSIIRQVGKRCNFSMTYDSEVIQQADNIEELCDGFYLEFGEVFDITNVYEKERYKDFQNFYNQLNDTLIINAYGFIKTSKGLIYVAKMNEKGELCLI